MYKIKYTTEFSVLMFSTYRTTYKIKYTTEFSVLMFSTYRTTYKIKCINSITIHCPIAARIDSILLLLSLRSSLSTPLPIVDAYDYIPLLFQWP